MKYLKMRSVVLQQEDNALMNCKMLCHKKEDAPSGREQACIKQEGEIKDQNKYLKMRSIALQQEDDVLMNQEMWCSEKEDVLSGREQICIKQEGEI